MEDKLFHVHPMMVGAFGGTAVQAQDLILGDRERTYNDLRIGALHKWACSESETRIL